jgi:hypothetical protein
MTALKVVDNTPLPRLSEADIRDLDLERQRRDPEMRDLMRAEAAAEFENEQAQQRKEQVRRFNRERG